MKGRVAAGEIDNEDRVGMTDRPDENEEFWSRPQLHDYRPTDEDKIGTEQDKFTFWLVSVIVLLPLSVSIIAGVYYMFFA